MATPEYGRMLSVLSDVSCTLCKLCGVLLGIVAEGLVAVLVGVMHMRRCPVYSWAVVIGIMSCVHDCISHAFPDVLSTVVACASTNTGCHVVLQSHNPRTHTIIEAHPDVYAHMLQLGWDKRPGVRILFGRWQDVLGQLGTYDGIFFDTYGEYYEELRSFHLHLPDLLNPAGVYSFFNGLAPDNLFFHLVYGR